MGERTITLIDGKLNIVFDEINEEALSDLIDFGPGEGGTVVAQIAPDAIDKFLANLMPVMTTLQYIQKVGVDSVLDPATL